jgi:hypothetical protein
MAQYTQATSTGKTFLDERRRRSEHTGLADVDGRGLQLAREVGTFSSAREGAGGGSTSPSWISALQSARDGGGASVDPRIRNSKNSGGAVPVWRWQRCLRRSEDGRGGRWKRSSGKRRLEGFPHQKGRSATCGYAGRWAANAALPLRPARNDAGGPAALAGLFLRGGVVAWRAVPHRLKPDRLPRHRHQKHRLQQLKNSSQQHPRRHLRPYNFYCDCGREERRDREGTRGADPSEMQLMMTRRR